MVVLVVSVTGGWSFSVEGAGVGSTGFVVFPSTAVLGSGAAAGMPCAVGVCDCVSGGCVIAGGLF